MIVAEARPAWGPSSQGWGAGSPHRDRCIRDAVVPGRVGVRDTSPRTEGPATTTRTAFALAAGATGTLVVHSASPAPADGHTATVSVLHAVPDTPVDVYANGERLIDAAGTAARWRVVSREVIEEQALPVERLSARTGEPRLVPVTCGGPFLPAVGGYRDDVVVVAEPLT